MNTGLLAIFFMVLVTAGFVFVALWAGKFFRPNKTSPAKEQPYECGEIPAKDAWFNYNPRFYMIALIFVVFDVEMVFMFPVITVFNSWIHAKMGVTALLEVTVFVLILLVALFYLWARGELRWIKDLVK